MFLKQKVYLKLHFFFLLFIAATFSTFSQSSANAHKNIASLKKGALFIKLKTSENVINGLIERGRKDEAEKIRAELALENKEIINAFKNNFTFCKVFFFYSNNSQKIKDGNYTGCLLNTNYEIDSTFNGSDYLIGEFGQTETNRIDAFLIEDKNFNQLKKPFPFLIRLNKFGVATRSKDEMAKAVNEELTNFWNKNSAK
jgi:hypothetical protein